MTLASRFLGSPWAGENVWKKLEQRKAIREKVPGAREIPFDKASKRVLALASEEADPLSSKQIGTEHLLLGVLREEKSLGAEILSELGVRFALTRQELSREPHDDSPDFGTHLGQFVRRYCPFPLGPSSPPIEAFDLISQNT